MKFRFSLLPREESFFEYFQEQARLGCEAGRFLVTLLDDFDNLHDHLKTLNDLERQGDSLVHKVSLRLARTFVTPIDREDIHALSTLLDDILDYIQGSAVKMSVYHVTRPTEPALQLARLIRDTTEVLQEAVDKLTRLEDISELRRRIKTLEKEADRVHREAVGHLFGHETNAIELIKWKEIYKSLEEVTDKCEDVMDVLEGIVIKYA